MRSNAPLQKITSKMASLLIYRRQFARFGNHSRIVAPLKLDGKRFIEIGDHVLVEYKTWLACLPLDQVSKPVLRIGSGCTIGHFNHIYATGSIILEDNVLTADKVYITDNQHDYTDPLMPIMHQKVRQSRPVRIGSGSWIGENAVIMGASIGKHCVIGAQAVVTKDIPDYCVAVGNPARVIKQYNPLTASWETI